MRSIEQEIGNFVTDTIIVTRKDHPFSNDAPFWENGVIDPMVTLELTMFIEENFNIHINDAEINADNFNSISKVASLVRRKIHIHSS